MRFVGIDPGFHGAIGYVDEAADGALSACVWDTPILTLGTKGQGGKVKERDEFSVPEMWALLHRAITFDDGGRPADGRGGLLVGIEEVGPRPLEGVVSVFRFGEGYGLWRGLIVALGLRYERIPPVKWKRAVFGTRGMEKDASVLKAEQLFPKLAFRTERGALRDGRAEAVLIADYLRRARIRGMV